MSDDIREAMLRVSSPEVFRRHLAGQAGMWAYVQSDQSYWLHDGTQWREATPAELDAFTFAYRCRNFGGAMNDRISMYPHANASGPGISASAVTAARQVEAYDNYRRALRARQDKRDRFAEEVEQSMGYHNPRTAAAVDVDYDALHAYMREFPGPYIRGDHKHAGLRLPWWRRALRALRRAWVWSWREWIRPVGIVLLVGGSALLVGYAVTTFVLPWVLG